MTAHRCRTRRHGYRPIPEPAGPRESLQAALQPVEETAGVPLDQLPRPAGFGTEASTAAGSAQLVEQYRVPDGAIASPQEVALSIESNGQARVSIAGVVFGPFSGAVDWSIPLEGARLGPGARIRVFHQSTDGGSTTTTAQVVVAEVADG
jgi:hypothetical protein